MEECIRRSMAVAEELVDYYRQFGVDHSRFIHAIVEDFMPMPAFMDPAA